MNDTDLAALLQRPLGLSSTDEAGVRLEIVGGLPLWEAAPSRRHQQAVDRIRASIETSASAEVDANCAGLHLASSYIRFPDGSLKRPDISIFCREPDELDKAITLVPEAVIEIVSPGYAAKDLETGPRFYLLQGVKDDDVFDPHTLLVLHMRQKGVTRQVSPVDIAMECGCRCVV